MKQTTTHLCLELEVPTDTAERCVLAAMAPMTALSVGRRSILLTSRQMSAAAVLDTLTMLDHAQEALFPHWRKPAGAAILSARNPRIQTRTRKPFCKLFPQNFFRSCANAVFVCVSWRGT